MIPEDYVDLEAPKLFNKWTFDEIEVKDIALQVRPKHSRHSRLYPQDYIQVKNALYLPHTAGRYQVKRFRKAQVCPNASRSHSRSARSLSA